MKRLKVILEEDGKLREISFLPIDLLTSLHPDGRYDFSLIDKRGRIIVDHKKVSPIEIALYIPGIIGTIQFSEKYLKERHEKPQGDYLVEIKRVA